VLTLARETGWTEDYIMRRAPLARLMRYYHAALWINGAWTVKPSGPQAMQTVDELLRTVPIDEDSE